MVREKDPWIQAFLAKLNADKQWQRALESGNKEYILSAMEMCQITECSLLYEEERKRSEKLNSFPYDEEDPRNITLDRQRRTYLRALEEIMENTNGSKERKDSQQTPNDRLV